MPEHSTPIPGASPMAVRLTGLAAIVAPLLLLASTVGYVTDGNGINDGHVGGTFGVWSCFAFLLALVGIHRMVEPVAPRAAPIWMAVVAIGAAAGVGFNIDAILAADFGREAVDAVGEESPLVLLAYLPWGLFFPIGLVGTGVLLWRTRVVPHLTAALVVAGGLLFVASRPPRIDPLAVFGDCVLVLAFAPIGWALLTGRRLVRIAAPGVAASAAA
ncbi:MAG: hypothetical protein AB7L84_10210 [Acidimicrobiia bacterium]